MPKRTIKLRQAQAKAYGRDFVRVGNDTPPNALPTFPNFNIVIQVNPNWMTENINWIFQNMNDFYNQEGQYGFSSLNQLVSQQSDFWMQQVTFEDFGNFLFDNTIFENTWEGLTFGALANEN